MDGLIKSFFKVKVWKCLLVNTFNRAGEGAFSKCCEYRCTAMLKLENSRHDTWPMLLLSLLLRLLLNWIRFQFLLIEAGTNWSVEPRHHIAVLSARATQWCMWHLCIHSRYLAQHKSGNVYEVNRKFIQRSDRCYMKGEEGRLSSKTQIGLAKADSYCLFLTCATNYKPQTDWLTYNIRSDSTQQ